MQIIMFLWIVSAIYLMFKDLSRMELTLLEFFLNFPFIAYGIYALFHLWPLALAFALMQYILFFELMLEYTYHMANKMVEAAYFINCSLLYDTVICKVVSHTISKLLFFVPPYLTIFVTSLIIQKTIPNKKIPFYPLIFSYFSPGLLVLFIKLTMF